MNRDQIIETMAMSLAVGRGRVSAGPGEIKEAERALTAVLPMIRDEVLEEAARVAEYQLFRIAPPNTKRQSEDLTLVQAVAREIVRDIRAMKGDKP